MIEWREVYGFDILYEVSNKGQIRTKHHGKYGYQNEYVYLKPTDNGKGYLRVNLKTGNKQRTVYVHILVAQAFVPNPEGYKEINHKDENKQNNNADNLEWCDHLYNCNYGTRNERSGIKRRIKVQCVETNVIFESLEEAANEMNVCKSAIVNCLKGRSKSCGGYTWRYADV